MLLIDGGKGQVHAVQEAIAKMVEEGAPEDLLVLFNGWGGRGVPTIVIYDDYIE